MDRATVESQLMPHLRFGEAQPADDAEIRRLLRENPFAGEIAISLETEPEHDAASAILGDPNYTIIARKDDRIVCAGTVTMRERFINGQPTQVGYLSGLRLDQACRRQLSIIRGGYDLFHQRHLASGPSVYLTSIVADNQPARRLLERGLPGMPTYSFLDYFVTLVFPARRISNNPALARLRRQGFRVTRGREADLDQLADFLNQSNSRYQFAPKWTADCICTGGLRPNHFRLARRGAELVGCAALWDQRSFRQTVIRGYSKRLTQWKWLLNRLPGLPYLPDVGVPLAQGIVSHTATKPGFEKVLPLLIAGLRTPARSRGLDYLTVGFSASDPRLPLVFGRVGGRKYLSRIYAVRWPEDAPLQLDGRVVAPELALL